MTEFYKMTRNCLKCEKSASKAAEACHVSQPALSRAIRQLEADLGVTIVERKRKAFTLTEEGKRVIRWAHDILRGITELRQDASLARQGLFGIIRIGVIPTAVHLIPLILQDIRKDAGPCASAVQVIPNEDIISKLISKEIDFGIMYTDQMPQANSFEVRTLYAEHQVLAAVDDFELPLQPEITWEEAATLPLALLTKGMHCRQLIDTGFQIAGVTPNVQMESDSLELIHAELMLGNVVTILPIASFPLRISGEQKLQKRALQGFSPGFIGLCRMKDEPITTFASRAWGTAVAIDYAHAIEKSCLTPVETEK
ncbi:LysR family transcriptional regulator [Komagataeibacter saccharivorans]|uniref:LysR family transcriptional regulator n=4 Tax=Komagataeibacter intermedius TaxID=66229 RepID=A0A0N1F8G5_9PROT|nr:MULTISPECIES: LysR family transcriptional regulator [Komagataeibacter]KPH85051.1 LysR family transcriptional regulator [Komagataeibacter intermedius AF2]PYD49449.1 LysR family transcriptional regulator [Komagataeibacter saccharivorans]GBQ40479.1 LysR family transcriptional regulator [Komagataeibacter saccharivorans NRIC 0614]GBQ75776.1 LysR family transcriptional regulator [Komagataeibacter intermedius NRIC 0521]